MWFWIILVAYFVVGYLYVTIAMTVANEKFTDGETYVLCVVFWIFIALIQLFQLLHKYVVGFGLWLRNRK